MKISCQSCQAKYTIADEKVLGKIVKIRCKKCSATIVINGNELPGAQQATAYDYAGQSQDQEYTVNVADGDQRTMGVPDIAVAYRQGMLNDETFCWKDGMPDWLPLREIGELYAACTSGGGGSAQAPIDLGPSQVQELPAPFGPGHAPVAENNGGAGPMFPAAAAAAPTAARRAGGRAPAADLFGGAAHAGGEEDVMTSAPHGVPQLHEAAGDQKLTGARNENSVLFSLSALTSTGGPTAGAGGGGSGGINTFDRGDRADLSQDAGSGLIDIRALSRAADPAESKPQRSKIDDIMNLGGGGAFAPALNAPILAPPPLEMLEAPLAPAPSIAVSPSYEPPPAAGNKKVLFAAIGGGVALLAIIGIVIGIASGKKSGADEGAGSTSANPTDSALAMNTPAATNTNTSNSLPQGTDTSTATTAAPTTTKDPKTKPSATASATTTAPTATTTTTATATATTTATTATAKSDSLADELTKAAGKTSATATTTAAGASDQPFNMGEARARLASIAGGLGGCKRPDGPTGSGRVVVTFAPSGGVQSAVVQGPFSGTSVGACIAGRFSGARVPPFSPPPFSVSKSFEVN